MKRLTIQTLITLFLSCSWMMGQETTSCVGCHADVELFGEEGVQISRTAFRRRRSSSWCSSRGRRSAPRPRGWRS